MTDTPGTAAGETSFPPAEIYAWHSEYSPPPSSTAIWVVLFGVTMMFAAFSSALIVRKGSSQDWQSFVLPPILYLNTLILIASSFTLEVARKRVAAFMGGVRLKNRTRPAGSA